MCQDIGQVGRPINNNAQRPPGKGQRLPGYVLGGVLGPFKCYITQWGGSRVEVPGKKALRNT